MHPTSLFDSIENSSVLAELGAASNYQTLMVAASKLPCVRKLARLVAKQGPSLLAERILTLLQQGVSEEQDEALTLYLDLLYALDPSQGYQIALQLKEFPGFWTRKVAKAILRSPLPPKEPRKPPG